MPRASVEIRVDTDQALRAIRKLETSGRGGRLIRDRLLRATAEAVQGRAQYNLRQNETNATFRLNRSWEISEPAFRPGRFVVRLANTAPYAAFVEFGTKARGAAAKLPTFSEEMRESEGYQYNLAPSPLPPLDAIRAWTEIRGIPDEAVFPIALQIAREGISPQPFLGPAVETERARSRRRIRDLGRALGS